MASAPPGHRLKHPSATTCPSMGCGLASARPGHLLKHPSAVFSSSPRGRRCGSLQPPPMAWRNESQQTDNAAQPSVWPTCPTRPTWPTCPMCPTWPTRSSCPLLHDARVHRVILTPLGVSKRAPPGRPGAVRGRRRPPRCGPPQPNIGGGSSGTSSVPPTGRQTGSACGGSRRLGANDPARRSARPDSMPAQCPCLQRHRARIKNGHSRADWRMCSLWSFKSARNELPPCEGSAHFAGIAG